jgi:hypothetical protein
MADLPRGVGFIARFIPAGEREAILGDLVEETMLRDLRGARRPRGSRVSAPPS